MTARLLAVALAFAITGAPVAMALCEAACAARSADVVHGGRGEHHSCHQAASSDQVQIAGIPHGCGHSDGDDQIGAEHPTKVVPSTTAVITHMMPVTGVPGGSARIVPNHVTHSPPDALTRSTQLRI